MKVVVYSVNLGDKDRLLSLHPHPNCEFHYFTDKKPERSEWQIHEPKVVFDSPRKTSRWHKLHSHVLFPDADITIWFDSNLVLGAPLHSFLDHISGDFSSLNHPHRQCLYDEGEEIIRLQWESWEKIPGQLQAYRSEGYPEQHGLVSTRVVARTNSPAAQELNALWWQHVEKHSLRDQISLPYVLWKLGMEPNFIPHSFIHIKEHLHSL